MLIMELNINSPAYYTSQYGVNDAVYDYCQNLYLYFKNKEYSNTLHTIGIIPIIAPRKMYDEGLWKEKVQFINSKTCAMISIRLDYEQYYKANDQEKIKMMELMLIKAIKKIKNKGKFDTNQFIEDLLNYQR